MTTSYKASQAGTGHTAQQEAEKLVRARKRPGTIRCYLHGKEDQEVLRTS